MLLTIPEACTMIRVGRTRFYQLLNAGEIKAVKIGKKTLIPQSTILQWIEGLPTYNSANNGRTKQPKPTFHSKPLLI